MYWTCLLVAALMSRLSSAVLTYSVSYRSSCKTFESFSTAVEWIVQEKLGIANLVHLLDDFLLIQPTKDQCSKSLHLVLDLCDYLGIPMAPEKTCGPSTILTFAGIELDTIRGESRLPEDKLLKCQHLIAAFLRRKKATLKELQSHRSSKFCLFSSCPWAFIFKTSHRFDYWSPEPTSFCLCL